MSHLGVRILCGMVNVFGKLPLGFHYAVGSMASSLAKNVFKYRYDVVLTNLARSFPEKNYGEIREIANKFYSHFGDIFAEAIWFGASSYERLNKSGLVTITNPKVFNDLFTTTKSTTVLFSHCGNWEILGGLLGYPTATGEVLAVKEKSIKVVYKRLHNAVSNEFFKKNRVRPLLEAADICQIESDEILRYAMKYRNEQNVYIYIADQYPYMTAFDVGEFLHQQTKAMLGSVKLAHKLGHSVVYMGMKAVRRGKYEFSFTSICRDASKMQPEEIVRQYFDLLEKDINECPHNWLWAHKRWK